MAQATATTLSANDTAKIKEVTDTFVRGFLARDFDAVAALYTPDAVLLPPNHPVVEGQEKIKRFMPTFPKVTKFRIDIQQIDGREDLAYVRGAYSMTIEPEGAPGPVDDVGKFLEIRKRQPDGSWLFAEDMFNSDKP